MWASYKGHTQIVKALLSKHASPNLHDKYHMTCLIWAAGRGYTDVVTELLNNGAKVDACDKVPP